MMNVDKADIDSMPCTTTVSEGVENQVMTLKPEHVNMIRTLRRFVCICLDYFNRDNGIIDPAPYDKFRFTVE